MSIHAGLYAAVTFTKDAGDAQNQFVTGNTVYVEKTMQRQLHPDVTPLHATLMQFAIDTPMLILKLKGFLDSDATQGELNNEVAIVTFTPSINQPARLVAFYAWIQQFQIMSPIDDANRFTATIYANSGLSGSI